MIIIGVDYHPSFQPPAVSFLSPNRNRLDPTTRAPRPLSTRRFRCSLAIIHPGPVFEQPGDVEPTKNQFSHLVFTARKNYHTVLDSGCIRFAWLLSGAERQSSGDMKVRS
jgi:hypothetical protein